MRNLKFFLSVFFLSFLFVSCNNEPEMSYSVGVRFNKEGKNEPSMANGTLNPVATLEHKDGKRIITIKVKPLKFGSMTGNLIELVYLEKRAKKIIGTPEGHNTYEFEIDATPKLNGDKEEILTVKLFIDAMNVLYDETKGPEEQTGQAADLVIDHKTKKRI